jgi:hypothetical protein
MKIVLKMIFFAGVEIGVDFAAATMCLDRQGRVSGRDCKQPCPEAVRQSVVDMPAITQGSGN